MSGDLIGLLTILLTVVSGVLGIYTRKAALKLRAAESQQAHYAGLEAQRQQQYDEVMAEVKRLRDEKLAAMQTTLEDWEADNIKLRRGLEALENARNRDMEAHEADRRQWVADKQRLESEMGQLRADLSAANLRIRDLEINKAKLEAQNEGLLKSNEQLSTMARQWNEALPVFIQLARKAQDEPAPIR